MPQDVILLDLGGVLVNVVSVQRLSELLGGQPSDIAALWSRSPSLRRYEGGQCDRDAFAHDIVQELGLPLSPEAFMAEFDQFLQGLYPGAQALLQELAQTGRTLACLTDTNPSQWASLCARTGLDRYFERCFLSYQLGATKPHPSVYRAVQTALGCAPGAIHYFDDHPANVSAGLRAGMDAHEVRGVDGLRRALASLGLLTDGLPPAGPAGA
jgi:HAD superfamily hydrolase (TIGR01509 family)